jgi:hypothetical protein
MKMGWEIAAAVSILVNIFLLARLLYYKYEISYWKRLLKIRIDKAEDLEELYKIMSNGFYALWRMHNSERDNHGRNQIDNQSV